MNDDLLHRAALELRDLVETLPVELRGRWHAEDGGAIVSEDGSTICDQPDLGDDSQAVCDYHVAVSPDAVLFVADLLDSLREAWQRDVGGPPVSVMAAADSLAAFILREVPS